MGTILGIDPGTNGGFAWMNSAHGVPGAQQFDGLTEHDIAEWLSDIASEGAFAYLELVGANRGKGDRRQGASSMFTFGQGYGFLRGALVALKIPFEAVRPQVWLPAMGLRGIKDESQTNKKNRHKALAQRLWPTMKITHKVADAMLLCEYGRRQTSSRTV